jgi:chromosomal replication initiation ATPase DnaA
LVREIFCALSSNNQKDIGNLKDEYQSYDLLLINDIQFLSKKKKSMKFSLTSLTTI